MKKFQKGDRLVRVRVWNCVNVFAIDEVVVESCGSKQMHLTLNGISLGRSGRVYTEYLEETSTGVVSEGGGKWGEEGASRWYLPDVKIEQREEVEEIATRLGIAWMKAKAYRVVERLAYERKEFGRTINFARYEKELLGKISEIETSELSLLWNPSTL
jgi:hypothetical protein